MTNITALFPTKPTSMDSVLAGYCARAGGNLVAAYFDAGADAQRHAQERGFHLELRLYKREGNDLGRIE